MVTTVPSLAELRQELSALFDEMSVVLAKELTALRQRDSEGLEHHAARKLELVAALEAATGNYCRAGGKLDRQSLATLARQAKACAQANRINGGAIELNRAMTGRLLETLRGGPRPIATYDASGRLQQRASGRPVGLA
jgi:flagellar biosynthesis/type III secretory pathway chaperone